MVIFLTNICTYVQSPTTLLPCSSSPTALRHRFWNLEKVVLPPFLGSRAYIQMTHASFLFRNGHAETGTAARGDRHAVARLPSPCHATTPSWLGHFLTEEFSRRGGGGGQIRNFARACPCGATCAGRTRAPVHGGGVAKPEGEKFRFYPRRCPTCGAH